MWNFKITNEGGRKKTVLETRDGEKIDLGNPKPPQREILTDPNELDNYDKDFKDYIDELPSQKPPKD